MVENSASRCKFPMWQLPPVLNIKGNKISDLIRRLASRRALPWPCRFIAGCILKHLSQALDVTDQQCIAAARDEPIRVKRLSSRVTASLWYWRGWRFQHAWVLGRHAPRYHAPGQGRQSQHLGLDPVVDMECAELIDTSRNRASSFHELLVPLGSPSAGSPKVFGRRRRASRRQGNSFSPLRWRTGGHGR